MPSDARRLHPFTVVSRTIRVARQLVFPALLGGASIGSGIDEIIRWTLIIAAVPAVLAGVARWAAFRFRLDDDELIIDSGVFARRRRVIPLARVQNIDVQQSALERLARVAEVRLETASGGRETEASLAVLRLDEAQELQSELLRRSRASRPAPSPASAAQSPAAASAAAPPEAAPAADSPTAAPAAVTIFSATSADLAIAGATANEAGLIAAGLATLLGGFDDLGLGVQLDERLGPWFDQVVATVGAGGVIVTILAVIATFIVLGWLASIVATVVRFHGFTLTRDGEDLRKEYGLAARRRSTIPIARVQAVRIEETLLRRPLGFVALKIETAGAGPARQQPGGGGGVEAFVPLARRRDVGRLLAEVFPDARFDGVAFQPVAPVARRRSFTRLAVPIVLAAFFLATLRGPTWLALLAFLAPAWLLARAEYRARGWARTPGYALTRGGVLTRITWVVPERKIQTLHLSESVLQRRHGIGTVVVDTAAGGRVAHVADVEREVGLGLLEELRVA